jgi:hypothetical protein
MNKMKKVTKKHIQNELRTLDPTRTFKVAKMAGVDVKNKYDVHQFVLDNAPTKKVERLAYTVSIAAGSQKLRRRSWLDNTPPATQAIRFAKWQKENGAMETNYGKILIVGNSRIYWASPVYKHQDYNKAIAMQNTEKNRALAQKINNFLLK